MPKLDLHNLGGRIESIREAAFTEDDDEKATCLERELLYDFVIMIEEDVVYSQQGMKALAAELRKVKDFEFRRI